MNKITNFLCVSLLLLGATAAGMNNPEEQLLGAARRGNLGEVERLIACGISVEVKSNGGSTPLIFAAIKGHEDVCKLLIANKASVDAKDNDGRTPLYYAARQGYDAAR